MCVCVCVGSISSLINILLNNKDIFCLHTFVHLLSRHHIDFMASRGKLPELIGSLVVSAQFWAIIRGVYFVKSMRPFLYISTF